MVNESSNPQRHGMPFAIRITISFSDPHSQETIMSSLKPELAAINSKRVRLQVKSSRNKIVFHLAALDATALRAAAISLMRLYSVADGVLKLYGEEK
ncbi:MAG: KEOPS complex subunit Pcc1 [Promethearchaeota archaeon]